MERDVAWKNYDEAALDELEALAADYIDFISENKTERECATAAIAAAEDAGYDSLADLIAAGTPVGPGAKVWACAQGKAVILVHVGAAPLSEGMNILGAHIDSPRLDIKQNPLYEANDFALLDTHYYGGIKNYQWTALPLSLHGVVATTDGTVVEVNIGDDAGDPVFCVTDLLPHLGAQQMDKKGSKVVEGEDLDLLVGNRPLVSTGGTVGGAGNAQSLKQSCSLGQSTGLSGSCGTRLMSTTGSSNSKEVEGDKTPKDPVKAHVLALLADKYGITEEDFLSAELEVVPAGRARDLGFDRSMVIGYGQDDRVCAYTSLAAQLALGDDVPARTAVCVLVDKEEIGSVGASGMASMFFENTIAEIMALSGEDSPIALRRALTRSRMLSSDVSAGFDPAYASVFEAKNSAYLGRGLVFNKYTGARGKSGSNDASAEYVAQVRRIMDDAHVSFQTAELGRVDAGGGGTIAYIPAKYGMDVIDSGVPVLSMHSPWEVTSKADIYEARRGYEAFLRA
ncbi:aminopeptidase 1 [Adlercreutzia sp. R21]|uniref:aminopeptidase 1 n=1 Tax=Adlercreutzia wanghongyangiae TaxID=3111451 RepID=UPI002DB9FDFD|nr:aminopeptidase 1 [Adlercreutzia sp. R21]MEC4185435.1 aminopeptidase 1 [Adlercreutzia sp. R21]